MAKKIILSMVLLCFGATAISFAADCNALISQYAAPAPEKKTIAQLKRWVARKVTGADAGALESCLIARAADNPNKDQVAGK